MRSVGWILTLNPLLVLLDLRREHVDVLHGARPRAAIGVRAVWQGLTPDDEIAGPAADGARAERTEI